jgi:hypothetical protein
MADIVDLLAAHYSQFCDGSCAGLAGRIPSHQTPGDGCSIKWKTENEPDWA